MSNENQYDGSKTLTGIKALEDYSADNYPAFYWADNYKEQSGWYIPAYGELLAIYNAIETVNAALEKLGGDTFGNGEYDYYSSCTSPLGSSTNIRQLKFKDNTSWNTLKTNPNDFCVIRVFE